MLYLVLFVLAVFAYLYVSKLRHDKWIPLKVNSAPRAVLITGCDTGFGNMLAKDLDALGVQVYAGCLTEKGAQELKAQCSENLTALVMDVANEESVQAAFEEVQKKLGPNGLWAVVNNAGIALDYWIEFIPMSLYRKTMDVNFFGMVSVTKVFLPLIKKTKGRIVNITSVAGLFSTVGMSAYSASKFAGESFSDALRREMAWFGVTVSIIEPGFMRTPIVMTIPQKLEERWKQVPEALRKEYGEEFRQKLLSEVELVQNFLSDDPQKVVEALKSALFSQAPKNRYLVGRATWFFKFLSTIYSPIADVFIFLRNPRIKQPPPS